MCKVTSNILDNGWEMMSIFSFFKNTKQTCRTSIELLVSHRGIGKPMSLFHVSILFISCSILSALAEVASPKVIAIQPYEGIPMEHVQEVRSALENYYHYEVKVLPSIPLPDKAFIKVKSPRYRADILLRLLNENLPKGVHHVIGLTAKDISTTKYENWQTREVKKPEWKYEDWGIFGLGQTPGTACIVSTYRLKGNVSQSLFLERLRKVVCHEVGHNLGLLHCEHSTECFMRDGAESINTVDHETEKMCHHCEQKIKR